MKKLCCAFLWRIAFMMLVKPFSLASCSSDDDVTDNVFN